MGIDLTSPNIIEWLNQFDLEDQSDAADLLRAIQTVDASELTCGLRKVIQNISELHPDGALALFSERHIRRNRGKPNRLFKETRKRPHRAYGNSPAPVPQSHSKRPETGSEGIIATLITGLARSAPTRFLDHPPPDRIRKERARVHVVVTDFIGSGRRASDNLEAAWKLSSFKSWHSYGLIRFIVASYSGTQIGVKRVSVHRSDPKVFLHRGCPTIRELGYPDRERVEDLCRRYAPKNRSSDITPLGYNEVGALIAFDHGVPNNSPALLHTNGRGWVPLFPRRSVGMGDGVYRDAVNRETIERLLMRLRETRIASSINDINLSDTEQCTVLVLSALKRTPRSELVISARTGLSIAEVRQILSKAKADQLIDHSSRLTKKAYESLEHLRRLPKKPKPTCKTNTELYFPSSLRVPRGASR